MKLIKLDAIDSTNDFLKSMSSQDQLENFTVVTAENQTKGKGQMGAVWKSETGKNLIMSVLVKDFLFDNENLYNNHLQDILFVDIRQCSSLTLTAGELSQWFLTEKPA